MNFVVVDNSTTQLDELADMLSFAFPNSMVRKFSDPLLSAKHICNNSVDAVFLEANMRPADGVSLLKVLRKQKPDIPVVILSHTEKCRWEAMQVKANEYWVRPITMEKLRTLTKFV